MRQSSATGQPSPSASPERDRLRRPVCRVTAWAAGALTFLIALLSLTRESYPPLPARLTLEVNFAPGFPGLCEPLIVTGTEGDGDFLVVRYIDANTAVLVYDVWGVGGPTSAPFALRAGTRRTLEIEMPTLAHIAHFKSREKRPLHVALDGQVLLHEPVHFHRRAPPDIHFAHNPIGGSLARERFRGKLTLPDGRELRGGPDAWFGPLDRVGWFIRHQTLTLLGWAAISAVVGLLAGWLLPWLARLRLPRPVVHQVATVFPARRRAPHGCFVATATICSLIFVTVITGGTFRLFAQEDFGQLYDFQAMSLLEGRLDLPPAAHNSESFIFENRIYMYFGPTPALLRLPLVYFKIAPFQWSRCLMLVYYVALLAAVYALLLHVARRAGGSTHFPSRFNVVLFVMLAGLGTTFLFLASRAYVYHEAILCGAMFASWGAYCSLRYLREPDRGWWLGAIVCGCLAVHARPPTGLFALAMTGSAAIAVAIRQLQARATTDVGAASAWHAGRRPLLVAGLATVGILSFNGLSYLKFRSFEGAPLKYHVQYHPGRLAVIGGRNFHLANFHFNFDAYIWRPDFTWQPGFPFFHFKRGPDFEHYVTAKIDLAEPTLALPYAMPALFLLAIAGGTLALYRWPEAREPLGVIAAGAAPMVLALFTAIAISHRYTADFCPPLLLAGAFGLQAFNLLPPAWRRLAFVTVLMLTILGILLTLALTLHFQGAMIWGVPADVRERYESLRKAVDSFLGFPRT